MLEESSTRKALNEGETKFTTKENVIISDLTDWDGNPENIEADEEQWLDTAIQSHITAAVVDLGDVDLSSETQKHITSDWSKMIESTDIEKVGYVSDGIKAMAVSANLESDAEIETFDTLQKALEWAEE